MWEKLAKLKPCPLCGSRENVFLLCLTSDFAEIECKPCRLSMVAYQFEEPHDLKKDIMDILLEKWNRRPVRHGRWIVHYNDIYPAESTQECSECHEEVSLLVDCTYCPNCGSKNDEVWAGVE